MTNGTMRVAISKRFDGDCNVYAFDVNIDGDVYREVSRDKAFSLIIEAQDVAVDLDMFCVVSGMHYLRNNGMFR